MNRIQGQTGFVLFITAVLSIVVGSRGARAQDDVFVEDFVPVQPDNAFMVKAIAGMEITVERQVDQLLFGRFGGAGVARNKLDAALALRIDDLDRNSGVTEDQKKKLHLAGRGDIKRFFDRVEETKRQSIAQTNPQFNNIWQDIQPLQSELNAGLFGDNSLFAKTIKRTLNDEQKTKYESVLNQRKLTRYQAVVGWFVIQLDKTIGLSHDQRRRLVELLGKETKPPTRFGQQDYWLMMIQASRVPEASFKPIFDDVQWRLVSRQLAQAEGMRPFLEMNGTVIDEDKPARARPAAAVIMPGMPLAPAVPIEKAAPAVKALVKKKE